MSNAFLVLIAIAALLFIGLMWLRFRLITEMSQVNHHLAILNLDLSKRRDKVPLLLESIRRHEHPDERWQILLNKRADFHQEQALSREWDFEKLLLDYLDELNLHDTNFLEVKKGITDLTETIQKEFDAVQTNMEEFNALRKRFPYSVASGIFGLPEMSL